MPARHIKYRFKKEEIIYLLEMKRWEKDLEWIDKHKDDFKDIKSFIQKNKYE